MAAIPAIVQEEMDTVCFGDSLLVFGGYISAAGVYEQTFPAANGCDSTHRVFVTAVPEILPAVEGTPSCWGAQDGSVSASAEGGARLRLPLVHGAGRCRADGHRAGQLRSDRHGHRRVYGDRIIRSG